MALPTAIYSARQIRELDEYAIRVLGIPGYVLMKRAGEASLRIMRTRWPRAHLVVIVCGAGNNGGDGYVLARFAQAAGLDVRVVAAVDPARLGGDARRAFDDFTASNGHIQPFAPGCLAQAELVVDALLGTGLAGPVRPELAAVIAEIAAAGHPVLALDIPSGLSGDSGLPQGSAVRADCTITFIGLKTGLYLGDGPDYCGTVFFDDLEVVPPEPAAAFAPKLQRILESEIAQALPRRARSSHKGTFGRVLIIGSGPGMPGATRLAGEAALRVGAGLVTVAVAPQSMQAVASGRPELIVHALEEPGDLAELVARADVVAIGPGLGRDLWAREVLRHAVATDGPLIADADALNLLAEGAAVRHANWILTPHPGEAGRLLGCDTATVQADRLGALDRLVGRSGGIVVLKGAGSLIGAPGKVAAICERGNPGMAAPGMGDVLTGAIAGILAQVGDPWVAARVAVLAHAMAGDAEARNGERGVLASDVARELRSWVNLQ